MELLLSLIIFAFGAIIGSFLNVVILRYNTGRSVQGRSGCFSCGKKLRWSELVPIFSFLAQKGKCRTCQSHISWQYPLVEVITGLLFLAVFWREGFAPQIIFFLTIISLFVVLMVYDIRHKIIPNGFVYAISLLALARLFWLAPGYLPSIWELLAGPILFLPFFLLWWLSRGRWMGLGDGKLALAMGWLLGLSGGIAAVLLAFWAGLIASIALLVASRKLTMKSEIPFAPFLILSTIAVYLLKIGVEDILYFFARVFHL